MRAVTSSVLVFAAASLTDAFDRLEAEFEVDHPDIDVVISYAGSSALAGQIEQGAPADVFAAADPATIDRVLDSGNGLPVVFAVNRLSIVVAPGNPHGISGLADLADRDLVVVLADFAVPAAAYAADVLDAGGRRRDRSFVRVECAGRRLRRSRLAKPTQASCTAPTSWPTLTDSKRYLSLMPRTVVADYPIVVMRLALPPERSSTSYSTTWPHRADRRRIRAAVTDAEPRTKPRAG